MILTFLRFPRNGIAVKCCFCGRSKNISYNEFKKIMRWGGEISMFINKCGYIYCTDCYEKDYS